MSAPRNVSKGFVDRNPFDERSEIIEHIDGGIAQPLIILGNARRQRSVVDTAHEPAIPTFRH